MRIGPWELRRAEPEVRTSPENPTVPVSAEALLAFWGIDTTTGTTVTVDAAMKVPAVQCAVNFLSSSLANLPLHAYRTADGEAVRQGGKLQILLNEAPNPEWSSYAARKYFWMQVFQRGRGLYWIERTGLTLHNIWPLETSKATVRRVGERKVYVVDGKTYDAADVIDVPFMLKSDQLASYSPIMNCARAINLALAMEGYASGFFAGGGVPPLALTGPLPQGAEGLKRAMADVHRAVEAAKKSNKPIFPMPPGHELKPVGFDPEKGQMTEARRMQVEEIARAFNLPPVFLQDLTRGTFSNTEQQDLHLTKHVIAQWAKALEDEINLKLFGQMRNSRYVEHSLDGLLRGDFKTRMEALARGVQTAQLTPNEARALENRGAKPKGDDLYIQGATVPLGSQPVTSPVTSNGGADGSGNPDADAAG